MRASAAPSACQYQFIEIQSAEDFAPVPGTSWMIASSKSRTTQVSAHGDRKGTPTFKPGGIYAIDRRNRSFHGIWPHLGQPVRRDVRFGDVDAPPEPATFSVTGLHLQERRDGVHTLYVINNEGRHSVELYEVRAMATGPSLTWIGALLLPYPWRGNSITVLPDGTAVVTITHLLDDPDVLSKMKEGRNTGFLARWRPGEGWNKLEGTDSSAPNGVLASADGKTLYYAASGGRHLIAAPMRDLTNKTTVALHQMPDNLRWDDRGLIWAGGVVEVGSSQPKVSRIDPRTLAAEWVSLPVSDEFTHCSVAIELEDEIWLGSFNCDLMAVIPKNDARRSTVALI